LYQKCLILCNRILLNVLHNTNSTVLLPWQHIGFQTSPILRAFLAPLAFHFDICQWCPVCMIQQAYEYVTSSLSHHLMFLCWKSPTDWNKVGGHWQRVSCHGNRIFVVIGAFPLELLAYQVSMVCEINLEYMTSSVILFAYFT